MLLARIKCVSIPPLSISLNDLEQLVLCPVAIVVAFREVVANLLLLASDTLILLARLGILIPAVRSFIDLVCRRANKQRWQVAVAGHQ